MAELPEIYKIANQMNDRIAMKSIAKIELLQEKCSNKSSEVLNERLRNSRITKVFNKGKWIFIAFENKEFISISVGMGGDIIYYEHDNDIPEKYQINVCFSDGTGFTIKYWWFGKFNIFSEDELKNDENTKDIGMSPFDEGFTVEYFANLLAGSKKQIKSFVLDQKNIGGIGNMYIHDILFLSKLHPKTKISDISEQQIKALYESIIHVLNKSRGLGAFAYENDFFGEKGRYDMDSFLIGYKKDKKCPACGETIIHIKTGSTTSFICPRCQVL